MLKLPIYLDNNATTPCDPRVVEAMLPYFTTQYGNAASHNHSYGWQAAEAVELAREQVAALIGAEPKEIIFTSGATESVNLALKGVFETYFNKGNHFITDNIEHNAVLDTCKRLEQKGAEISYVNAEQDGSIDSAKITAAIRQDTILISIMYANNEIGTIMPVREISAIAKTKDVLFFSDATQAVGKIKLNVNEDGIDLMAFSAHKIYGPKGVGALFVRRKNPRVKLTAQIDGGAHEKGLRSGTLNVPGIVGFGKACELCMHEMDAESARLAKLRNMLEDQLIGMGDNSINGNKENRLPHVTNIAFGGVDGNALMLGINKEIAVSTGSACTSATPEPSHVLKALGLSDELAKASLRFGLGRFTKVEEIEYTIRKISSTLDNLRTGKALENEQKVKRSVKH